MSTGAEVEPYRDRSGGNGESMLERTLLIMAAVAMATLTGCEAKREGSGVEASEARTVDPFSRISLSGETAVVVTVGEEQMVTVRGDDNLLDDVITEVDDGTIEIRQPSNVDLEPKIGITVEILVRDIEAVDVSGAGDISIVGVRGELFRVDVSGTGNIQATGRVDRVEVDISGEGNGQFAGLVTSEAVADISGAGDLYIHATELLDVSVSGAGDVTYTGDPAEVNSDISGAGEIKRG